MKIKINDLDQYLQAFTSLYAGEEEMLFNKAYDAVLDRVSSEKKNRKEGEEKEDTLNLFHTERATRSAYDAFKGIFNCLIKKIYDLCDEDKLESDSFVRYSLKEAQDDTGASRYLVIKCFNLFNTLNLFTVLKATKNADKDLQECLIVKKKFSQDRLNGKKFKVHRPKGDDGENYNEYNTYGTNYKFIVNFPGISAFGEDIRKQMEVERNKYAEYKKRTEIERERRKNFHNRVKEEKEREKRIEAGLNPLNVVGNNPQPDPPGKILGFYFILFQSTLSNNMVKCWIDGDENYTFYYIEELREFIRKAYGKDYHPIFNALSEALCSTSVFLWDIEGEYIKRVSRNFNEDDLYLKQKIKEAIKLNNNKDNGLLGVDLSKVYYN